MKEQVDIARDYLLENIVMHRILPGTVLFETIIAEKLSMSRTPVRQALNDAVAIGLLTHTKGKRGYLLPELSCKDMLNVLNTRKSIEVQAVHEATLLGYSWGNEQIKGLLKLIEEEKEAREQNRLRYSLINRDIHYNLVKLSTNPYLSHMFLPIFWRASLYDFHFSPFYNDMTTNKDTFYEGLDEHYHIVEAICNQKIKEAVHNVEKHITPSIKLFLKIYSKIEKK